MERIELRVVLSACALLAFTAVIGNAEEPATDAISPTAPLSLLQGNSLAAWETWLKSTGRDDPQGVFSVSDGVLHISGEDRGYVATKQTYKDYHLSLEYKWGARTDGGGYVRNSGVLLNGVGEHGAARGVWMTSIEVQLAQGCEGDFIVIRGDGPDGQSFPATITSDTIKAEDGRTRWKRGGEKTVYSGKQFWWSQHQAGFKEVLDTRGRNDVASPLGQWTRVDCICRGNSITVKINGVTVNECYDVYPSAGRILLQNEGNEVYFRQVELRPLVEEK